MPSPEPEKDETAPAQPKSPGAPQKTSPTRNATNGAAIRKPGVKPRTPANAPIHKRPPSKKAEPTLLSDFLLGRPSASRQRRKSLDAVKAEMRESTVNRIQKPGGVHDRVKQWQKASAAAAIEEAEDPESELDEIIVEVEEESVVGPSVVTEDNRLHARNQNTRPGRRKNRDPQDWAAEVRSKSAPRKRVISDDHWVMNKTKASPKKKDIKVTMRAIPKDFLQQTAANPKLESKIADWVKRTEAESGGHEAAQSTPRASKSPYPNIRGENKGKMRAKSLGEIIVEIEEEPTRKPSKNRMKAESRSTPSSRKNSNNGSKESLVSSSKGKQTPKSEPSRTPANDGIKVKASGPNGRWEDGIRVKPLQARWRAPEAKKQSSGGNPFLDGISLKPTPVHKDDKQAPLRPEISDEYSPHKRKSSEKYIKMSKENEKRDTNDHSDGELDRSPNFRKQRRRSRSPSPSVDGIPFGDSAFSTLDLPIGAEAGNTGNKPKPQRNPSHLVPKVLKRVYNEGKKIIHDTHDAPEMPPRGGVNRPPTIESWLNGTTDPFLDVPSPVSTPELPEESTKVDDSEEHTSKPDQKQALEEERRGTGSRQKRVRKTSDNSFRSHNDKSPLSRVLDDPIEFKKPPTPPAAGLRRSPALRAASPPVVRSARKSPFKDALLDAFRGESTFEGILDIEDDDQDQEKENYDVDDIKNSDRSLQTPENNNSQRSRSSGTHLQVPDGHRDISDRPRRKRRGGSSGNHHLSKLASVETFSTLSSVDTSSNLTKTTLTQATTQTGRSDSNVSRRRSNRSGLKRRLTKHSDLVSMLSLPDAPPAGRTKSIRSARSVRTARSSLETATEMDLMRELAGDEVKYMRELKTLVDGVIPVLLTCVLSKSDSAIAAGLFNPDSTDMNETFLTKPIVDMGVALERLKSLHRRIPLQDPDALIVWLQRAHRTYQDYTRAWRLGFQDVIVNLAPASRKSSAEDKESPLDSVPRNADGDIVNSNGERVDVAFLLKRPLVRIKYLAKLTKGLDKLNHSELSGKALKIFDDLQETARRRVKEEHARLEDLYANNTDATRARNPQTLAPVEDVHIDRTRQVSAKDFFDLDFPHSNGQRIECRVELILRDNLSDEIDPGDVLICASEITPEATHRYLLFPPIDRDFISACAGEKPDELIIMIRGIQRPIEWRESLLLKGAEPETAAEWIEMLGSIPMPQPVLSSVPDNADTLSMMSMDPSEISEAGDPDDNELPIGARRRRRKHHSKERPRSSTFSTMSSVEIPAPLKIDRKETSSPPRRHRDVSLDETTGQPSRRHSKSSRYHSHTRTRSTPSSPLSSQLVLDDSDEESRDNDDFEEYESRASTPGRTSRRPLTPSEELPYIPKVRKTSSAASIDSESTTKDYSRRTSHDPVDPDDTYERSRSPDFAEEESAPPPPPAHRSMSPSGLKQPIIIEPPAPRSRSRRTSSPLKHEYRPSDISDISERSERSEVSVSEVSEMSYSSSEESDTEEEESSSSSDEDELDELDELEAADLPEAEPAPTIYGRRAISPTTSLYSLPNVTLAPVNTTPRIPIVPKFDNTDVRRHVATVTTWNNAKGRWDDVHSKSCSIIIRPGLIEVHEMSSRHSSPAVLSTIQESIVGGSEETSSNEDKRPILGQVLTPVVTLRQSNSLDIEIHSPPTSDSRVKCSPTIRYHSLHNRACVDLYNSIHQARMNNPTYKKLEEERLLNSYGDATYETGVVSKKRSFLSFGRKKSYRASTRAPSVVNSEQSSSPSTSRFSESFKRLTGSSFFNIAKSSIESGRGSSPSSLYTSSSGLAPPQTPHPASLAGTSTSYGGINLTSENIKIRLYYLETKSKWRDCGNARLTVTAPPPGMRQACAVDQGVERRILVTRKPMKAEDPDEKVEVLLDVVLGANCFSMIGNKGVTCNVWEDIVGPNGEVGMVGAIGRVSGRTRKWCLQAGSVPEASWIYNLVGVGR